MCVVYQGGNQGKPAKTAILSAICLVGMHPGHCAGSPEYVI
jgi:hypothetical protein